MRQGELGWAHRAPPRSSPSSAGAHRVFLPLPRLDFCLVQGPISAVPLAWVPEPHAVSSALTPPCVADTHLSQAESLASTTRVCSSKEKKNRITSTCSNHSDFSPSPPPSPPLQPPRRQDPGSGMGQERCQRWPAPSRAAGVARSAAHVWGRDEHVNEPVPARGE